MPKFAANLTMLYNEVDFLDRFEAAAQSGFKGVEYLFPYAYPKEQLAQKLAKFNLIQVLHNLPAGDWAAGERGIAVLPDRVNEFQESVGTAIDYATTLGCKQVNCLAGLVPKGVSPDKLRETFVANLKFAAPKFKAAGIKLLMEPINYFDMPGFYLNHTQQALDLIADVGSDRHLPHAAHGRRTGEYDESQHDEDRAPATRGQSWPQRTRHRRDQLPVPVRLPRPDRLHRLDRL